MNADDLAKILDELGQRLGPTGEHVFQLAVRQVYIDAGLSLVVNGVGLLFLIGFVVAAAKFSIGRWRAEVAAYAEGKGRWSPIQRGPDMSDYLFAWVVGGFLWLIFVCGMILGLVAALSRVLNPEYAALRDIIGQIVR